jgi:hypothetical protein
MVLLRYTGPLVVSKGVIALGWWIFLPEPDGGPLWGVRVNSGNGSVVSASNEYCSTHCV